MKMYGNIINRLYENQKEIPTIEVGMGVTEYLWSDRNVYEVTKVINQKDVFIRRYKVKHIGEYGNQQWEITSDENGKSFEIVYRYGNWWRKDVVTQEVIDKYIEEDGIYFRKDREQEVKEKGISIRYEKMNKLRFGITDYYYDFEF